MISLNDESFFKKNLVNAENVRVKIIKERVVFVNYVTSSNGFYY